MRRVFAFIVASTSLAHAVERPSFLQKGEAFCTIEADFDGFARRGGMRGDSATETCRMITAPTRVAVLGGRGGVKTEIRLAAGPNAYEIGWTNGVLPVQ